MFNKKKLKLKIKKKKDDLIFFSNVYLYNNFKFIKQNTKKNKFYLELAKLTPDLDEGQMKLTVIFEFLVEQDCRLGDACKRS